MKQLRWHKQERNYSCLPACLKMVFEYFGIIESEAALRLKCKTKLSGTHPLNAVECCKYYSLESYVELSNLERLKSLLIQDIPPIVNIFKIDAGVWYVHAVVVAKIGQNKIEVIDPEDGVMELLNEKFDELWSFSNRVVIVVTKKI